MVDGDGFGRLRDAGTVVSIGVAMKCWCRPVSQAEVGRSVDISECRRLTTKLCRSICHHSAAVRHADRRLVWSAAAERASVRLCACGRLWMNDRTVSFIHLHQPGGDVNKRLGYRSVGTCCTTNPEQIEVTTLEGYSWPACSKHCAPSHGALDRRRCNPQARPSTSFVDHTVNLPWRDTRISS